MSLYVWSYLCLFPSPLMSAPVTADPAKSSVGGLRRIHGPDDPISSRRLQRTEGKSSRYTVEVSLIFAWAHTAVLAADWQSVHLLCCHLFQLKRWQPGWNASALLQQGSPKIKLVERWLCQLSDQLLPLSSQQEQHLLATRWQLLVSTCWAAGPDLCRPPQVTPCFYTDLWHFQHSTRMVSVAVKLCNTRLWKRVVQQSSYRGHWYCAAEINAE